MIILNLCPLDYMAFAVSGKVGYPLTGLTIPILMGVVIPTDRPKSDRNRYVIDVFGGIFVLSIGVVEFSVDIRDSVIGLSQISFFFS